MLPRRTGYRVTSGLIENDLSYLPLAAALRLIHQLIRDLDSLINGVCRCQEGYDANAEGYRSVAHACRPRHSVLKLLHDNHGLLGSRLRQNYRKFIAPMRAMTSVVLRCFCISCATV